MLKIDKESGKGVILDSDPPVLSNAISYSQTDEARKILAYLKAGKYMQQDCMINDIYFKFDNKRKRIVNDMFIIKWDKDCMKKASKTCCNSTENDVLCCGAIVCQELCMFHKVQNAEIQADLDKLPNSQWCTIYKLMYLLKWSFRNNNICMPPNMDQKDVEWYNKTIPLLLKEYDYLMKNCLNGEPWKNPHVLLVFNQSVFYHMKMIKKH